MTEDWGRADDARDPPARAAGRELDDTLFTVLLFAVEVLRRLLPALVATRFLPPEFFPDLGLRDPTDRLEARLVVFLAMGRISLGR